MSYLGKVLAILLTNILVTYTNDRLPDFNKGKCNRKGKDDSRTKDHKPASIKELSNSIKATNTREREVM